MQNKSTARSAFFSPRTLIAFLIVVATCCIATGTLLAYLRSSRPVNVSQRTLTLEERVSYQHAIEDVYWRHRIWPKENLNPKPPLDAVMSQAQVEEKVTDYLRKSQAMEDYWERPITAEQLQAEMDRMARDTKQPEVLRELFDALGNDPFVIAECLARSTVVEHDFAIAELRTPSLEDSRAKVQTERRYVSNAAYVLPTISDAATGCTPDTWTSTTTIHALPNRSQATAVWTGSEMIVWGGLTDSPNTGGRYNPNTDSWTATSTTDAPAPRYEHTAVWRDSEMIVWGGVDCAPNCQYFNTGGRYNPSTDSWTATSTTNAPAARVNHTAVWSGSEMIVWGGWDGASLFNTGGRYNPSTDSWTATSTSNAPEARDSHTAVWTGSEMIVWGGGANGDYVNTGGRYNPSTDSWTATSTSNAPSAREFHTGVWTGSEMTVWGGQNFGGNLNSGGRYCAQAGPSPTPTPCTGRCTPTPRPHPTPRPRP
jgi:N-acetylneuraminic acid mutarotase